MASQDNGKPRYYNQWQDMVRGTNSFSTNYPFDSLESAKAAVLGSIHATVIVHICERNILTPLIKWDGKQWRTLTQREMELEGFGKDSPGAMYRDDRA